MVGFNCDRDTNCLHWRGNPNTASAYPDLLTALSRIVSGVFLAPNIPIGLRRKGNLGEFIAFHIGQSCGGLPNYQEFPTNAFQPLLDISRPGIDVVWIFFGASPMDDSAVLQEIKTTSGNELSLADSLPDDYEKLFGTDPSKTLKSRLTAVKNMLEFSMNQPKTALRLNKFIGVDPLTCENVTLLPTLVYDPLVAAPTKADNKMMMVKTTIYGLGWQTASVDGWAISLDDLDIRLQKLAEGRI